ncbi:family 43 glycosylhydrolase [Bacteroidota bacterium]
MKNLIIILIVTFSLTSCQTKTQSDNLNLKTFCNPVNLSYRFCLDEPSRREAADPTVVWFKDRYFLFASKSGGYWHSEDLIDWTFIETEEIPTEDYAPTTIAIKDTLFFLASSRNPNTIYKSTDPLSGKWSVACEKTEIPVWDPAFFLDEDNQLYLYWGCSNENPLYGVKVDYKNNFSFIGEPVELIHANPEKFGWEVPGDYNTLIHQSPWIEGPWMNKYKGKYYLQYSGPGTEFKSYADGVYVSNNPLGPFSIQPHNPFAYKPEGFTAGAGHGNTFTDKYGNYWHIGTITISQKHMFERRLGLYPSFFNKQGTLYTITKYGDYPLVMPNKKISDFKEIFPDWMLLSYAKNVEVSSSIDSLPPMNMTDENIRTYWAAKSGDSGEFAILDLGKPFDVYALQINFSEHNTTIFGRKNGLAHKFIIEYTNDTAYWTQLIDKSNNNTDNTHEYIQLPDKVSCRYLKINNIEVPGGNFAISGLRIFGKGNGNATEKISKFEVKRNLNDKRSVNLTWKRSENATGYNISYGIDKDKLYHNYLIYQDTALIINSLEANQNYYFTIESFNENGITKSGIVVRTD